jgi:hypothetical protein
MRHYPEAKRHCIQLTLATLYELSYLIQFSLGCDVITVRW